MRLLNLGSLNLDRVYRVPHFVAPGETLASTQLQEIAGGKGLNQSIAAAKAGLATFHAGKIGPDGAFLLRTLEEGGVDTSLVATVPDCPTGHAVIQVVPEGQNCILLFGGANQQIEAADVAAALTAFGSEDALLLQNETSQLETALRLGAEKGMRVILNPSPISPALLATDLSAVSLFILNELEGAALSGGQEEPDAILAALQARYPHADIVLTLGKQGARYLGHGCAAQCPAFSVPAVDTTAAGDTFTGYFLSAWLTGKDPREGLRLASAASAIAVGRHGAAPSIPTREEVLQFLSQHV